MNSIINVWHYILCNIFPLLMGISSIDVYHFNVWICLWQSEVTKKHAPYERLSALSTNNHGTLLKCPVFETGDNAISGIFDANEFAVVLATS